MRWYLPPKMVGLVHIDVSVSPMSDEHAAVAEIVAETRDVETARRRLLKAGYSVVEHGPIHAGQSFLRGITPGGLAYTVVI